MFVLLVVGNAVYEFAVILTSQVRLPHLPDRTRDRKLMSISQSAFWWCV